MKAKDKDKVFALRHIVISHYTQYTLIKLAYFAKVSHYIQLQMFKLSGASVSHILKLRASVMPLLMSEGSNVR
jgi:23S rRNA maturation-related 3'-5' exoribonuclease YhaM